MTKIDELNDAQLEAVSGGRKLVVQQPVAVESNIGLAAAPAATSSSVALRFAKTVD